MLWGSRTRRFVWTTLPVVSWIVESNAVKGALRAVQFNPEVRVEAGDDPRLWRVVCKDCFVSKPRAHTVMAILENEQS